MACHKVTVQKTFKHKIFQRYKDMNLTDWDELNSIDLRTGLTTMNFGPLNRFENYAA